MTELYRVRYLHRPRVYFYRDGRATGFTVAYSLMSDGNVILSFAYCNPKDRFTKVEGRMVAESGIEEWLNSNITPDTVKIIRLEKLMTVFSDMSEQDRIFLPGAPRILKNAELSWYGVDLEILRSCLFDYQKYVMNVL